MRGKRRRRRRRRRKTSSFISDYYYREADGSRVYKFNLAMKKGRGNKRPGSPD